MQCAYLQHHEVLLPQRKVQQNPPEYAFELGESYERTSIRLPEGVLDLLDEALDWFDCSSRNALITEILVEWLDEHYPFDEDGDE